jgi:hypothetical protein
MFGFVRLPDLYEETLRETIKKAEHRKSECIKHNKTDVYPVGTLVLLKSNKISSIENQEVKKFFKLYDGPFIIGKILHCDTYVIFGEDGKERGIFNKSHLRMYHRRDDCKLY